MTVNLIFTVIMFDATSELGTTIVKMDFHNKRTDFTAFSGVAGEAVAREIHRRSLQHRNRVFNTHCCLVHWRLRRSRLPATPSTTGTS